jgi:hypothetical protein
MRAHPRLPDPPGGRQLSTHSDHGKGPKPDRTAKLHVKAAVAERVDVWCNLTKSLAPRETAFVTEEEIDDEGVL